VNFIDIDQKQRLDIMVAVCAIRCRANLSDRS
jgi:hypothetical protein